MWSGHSFCELVYFSWNRVLLAAPRNRINAAAMYPMVSRKGPNASIFQTNIPITTNGANIQKNTTSDLELFPESETISV